MSTPATLPDLPAHYPDGTEVRVELRLVHRTERAFKVAYPTTGPLAPATPTAWIPARGVHCVPKNYDGSLGAFFMRAGTYRRLRRELMAAVPAPEISRAAGIIPS